jgi:hypothetical protein
VAWWSALVGAICVSASLRRLVVAVAPTSLDADELRRALTGAAAMRRLARAMEASTPWEHALFSAFAEPDGGVRAALVSEQMLEFDARIARGSKVPRICASIASSAGFFFASLSVLQSSAALQEGSLDRSLVAAVDAFSWGVAAAAFCAVIHVRAGKARRHATTAAYRLVEKMESLRAASEPPRTRSEHIA